MGSFSTGSFVFDTSPNRSLKECGHEHFVADARDKLPLIRAGGAKNVEEAVWRLEARAHPLDNLALGRRMHIRGR
jgi:hypothetical protein